VSRFYHGTRSEIAALRASTGGEFGPGVYLTKSVDTAWFYATSVSRGPLAPHVLVVEAEIRNPVRIAKTDWIRKTQNRTPSSVQRSLMKKGHDAIIGVGINGYEEQVVLFDPSAARIVGRLDERGAARGRSAKASWHPSERQVDEAVRSSFVRGRPAKLVEIPISKVFFTDYGEDEYLEAARDPKGGPVHVKSLANAFLEGKDMAPAIGYKSDGYYVAHDGNHRIAAAQYLGIKKIPMVVYETTNVRQP
jgi:hypothetical protein